MLWLAIYGYLLTYLILPSFLDMLSRGGFARTNFQGKQVPVGAGLVLVCAVTLSLVTTLPFYWWQWEREVLIFLFLVVGMCLLGLVDDAIGSPRVRGIRGHISYFLREGCITTGLLKAVGGVTLALFTSWLLADIPGLFLIDGLLLSLSINIINLLDLRPGRAGKAFLILMFLAGIWGRGSGPFFLTISLVGAVLAYLPFDLKGLAMLGDTGSNVLGAGVGLALVWSFSPGIKVLLVLFLVLLHILSESYSLTKAIEGIPALAFLDRLGRPDS